MGRTSVRISTTRNDEASQIADTFNDMLARLGADAVRLWVRDMGPGIPPEEAERIFARFARGWAGNCEGGRGWAGPVDCGGHRRSPRWQRNVGLSTGLGCLF